MAIFLQIVLAFIIVLACAIAIGWWLFRHRLRQWRDDYEVAADLVDFDQLEPARIRLHRSSFEAFGAELATLWEQTRALGFQRMTPFQEEHGAFVNLIAARHRDLPIAAALVEVSDGAIYFDLFAVSADKRVFARGNGSRRAIVSKTFQWQTDPNLDIATALDDVSNHLADTNLAVNVKLFRAVYEQAHAARMDRQIVNAPQREHIEQRAVEKAIAFTPAQIDQAHEMEMAHWQQQIEQALLDRYRRTSQIDAVAWQELENDIHVVHSRLDDDAIEGLIVEDGVSQAIFDQCREQGSSGMDLYKEVLDRLPSNRRRKILAEVHYPIRALLYVSDEDVSSDLPTNRQYFYQATDAKGEPVQGAVYAADARDAKRQIAQQSLHDPKLILEPVPFLGDTVPGPEIDERCATAVIQAVGEGLSVTLLRSFGANWLLWAPPTLLLGWALWQGPPWSWGDYGVMLYAMLAWAALFFFVGPVVFYHRLMVSRVRAQHQAAKFWLAALRIANRLGGVPRSQLKAEQCKILAAQGQLDDALALWNDTRAEISEEEYLSSLVAIYDEAGDWESMIETQRACLTQASAKETATVDLALSLARHGDKVDEVQSLMETVAPTDLPEISLVGYHYVRGLLAARLGAHDQALRHYAASLELAQQFASQPLIALLVAEINGHAALAFKRTGEPGRSQSLWRDVLPILQLHPSAAYLIKNYAKA